MFTLLCVVKRISSEQLLISSDVERKRCFDISHADNTFVHRITVTFKIRESQIHVDRKIYLRGFKSVL